MFFSDQRLLASLVTASCAVCAACGLAQHKTDNKNTATVPVPPFTIKAELSPSAEEKLRRLHEGITVLAMFDGDALPGYGKDNAPMRDIVLGSDEMSADDTHTASFTHSRISQIESTHLSDKDYFLTINVFTSRKSDRNNLLDCENPENRMSQFANHITVVKCKLIGEENTPPTSTK